MTATLATTQDNSHLVSGVGFLRSTIIVACSLLAAFKSPFFSKRTHFRLLQAFSVVPGSAALFGVRGWDIQTGCGKTPAEILNQQLFKYLSTIGLFLPILTFSLMPSNTKDSAIDVNLKEKIKAELLIKLRNKPHIRFPSYVEKGCQWALYRTKINGSKRETPA